MTVAGLAILLAGCPGVVVNDYVQHNNYVRGEEDYAMRNGEMRVEVAGDTLGLPPPQFAARVVEEMRQSYRPVGGTYTLDASRETDPRYRIVMMFHPAPAVSANNVCAAPAPYRPAPRAPGERLRLLAAFCGGNLALSEAYGWGSDVTGVPSPNFPDLVRRVTLALFPKHDVRQETGGGSFP
jgi:hypothetical protein